MPERRYAEDEIRAIFRRAAREQDHAQRTLGASDGLTLAELTRIGEEAGLSPAFVARAARTLDRVDPAPPPARYLGLPVGVRRTVHLDRPLTNDEWEQLVGDLRYTFDARGKVRSSGASREWRNGNLVCSVEPAGRGSRVHLRTRKGGAQGNAVFGVIFLFFGLVALLATLTTPQGAVGWFIGLSFVATGGGVLASTAAHLPGWARARERQMEGVAERLLERTDAAAAPLLSADLDGSAVTSPTAERTRGALTGGTAPGPNRTASAIRDRA